MVSPSGLVTRSRHEVGVDLVADLALERERLEQRRCDHLRQAGDLAVEALPGGVLVVAAGQLAERLLGAGPFGPLDQQAAGFPSRSVGVYDATDRDASRRSRSRSAISCCGSSETR